MQTLYMGCHLILTTFHHFSAIVPGLLISKLRGSDLCKVNARVKPRMHSFRACSVLPFCFWRCRSRDSGSSESPGGLVTALLGSILRASNSAGAGWGLVFYNSNKFPRDAGAAGPGPTF